MCTNSRNDDLAAVYDCVKLNLSIKVEQIIFYIEEEGELTHIVQLINIYDSQILTKFEMHQNIS